MKPDINNRADIEKLVTSFYEKVLRDESISFYFTDVVKVNWEKHLPVMYDFWENVVFYTGNYTGNPMERHMAIHRKHTMKTQEFERWLLLFHQTIDEIFEGERAETVKMRAKSIATVMQLKILK